MTSPISEISRVAGDKFGQSASELTEAAAKNHPHVAKTRPEGDTVTLSMSARVKKMKEEGESAAEIASRLNVDIGIVERYLAVVPASAETRAQEMKQEGDSLSRIADQLGVDIKTVKSYLGVVPVPNANQALQLKQQGESLVEIANRLGVDVKTVKRYLGDHFDASAAAN